MSKVIITNPLIPNSTHDRVLILTDLEPDDAVALRMLKNIIKDVPLMIVVGEGNLNKMQLAKSMLDFYMFSNYEVLQGEFSEKDYPIDALNAYGITNINTENAETTHEKVITFLEAANSALIIGLKPLWELIPNIDQHYTTLKKCVLILYGSFNIRCMTNKLDKEFIANFLNSSFKHVILYESFFATGTQNSVNETNAKELFHNLDGNIYKLIKAWNDFIIRDCLETTAELAVKMNNDLIKNLDYGNLRKDLDRIMNRNLKIVSNIVDAHGKQMVLADFGLISFVFNNDITATVKRGTISLSDYTKVEESADGLVYVPTEIDFKAIIDGIIHLL